MEIDKVHDRILYFAKKNQYGHISHEQIDIALDMAQLDLFEHYYGDTTKYQAGRPVPPVAYGQTQKVNDSLRQFIKNETIDITFAPNGTITYPTDFRDFIGAYITYTDSDANEITKELEMVAEAQKGFALNSQLMSVRNSNDVSNAFITMEQGSFQIYPKTTYSGVFSYLKLPDIPVFAYTQSGRTITYNSGSSTQLEWGDDDIKRIIEKALEYIAVGLEDDRLFNQARIKDES